MEHEMMRQLFRFCTRPLYLLLDGVGLALVMAGVVLPSHEGAVFAAIGGVLFAHRLLHPFRISKSGCPD